MIDQGEALKATLGMEQTPQHQQERRKMHQKLKTRSADEGLTSSAALVRGFKQWESANPNRPAKSGEIAVDEAGHAVVILRDKSGDILARYAFEKRLVDQLGAAVVGQ